MNKTPQTSDFKSMLTAAMMAVTALSTTPSRLGAAQEAAFSHEGAFSILADAMEKGTPRMRQAAADSFGAIDGAIVVPQNKADRPNLKVSLNIGTVERPVNIKLVTPKGPGSSGPSGMG